MIAGNAAGYTPDGAWAGRAYAADKGQLEETFEGAGDTDTYYE